MEYKMTIAGCERALPLCPLNEDLYIGAFVIFGDPELTTACAKALLSHDNILIVTHKNPDGDTVGSAAALCSFLRRLGKKAALYNNPQITQKLKNYVGSFIAEDDFKAMDKVCRWADCPALASLELGTYEDRYLDITETGEVQDLLKDLYLGRRYFLDPDQQENPEADNNFWQAITEGATQ